MILKQLMINVFVIIGNKIIIIFYLSVLYVQLIAYLMKILLNVYVIKIKIWYYLKMDKVVNLSVKIMKSKQKRILHVITVVKIF